MKGGTTAGAGFFMGFFSYGGKEQTCALTEKKLNLKAA